MISTSSRYVDSQLVTIDNNGNNVVVIVPGVQESYTFTYVNYLVNGGDKVDQIANSFYNDPTQWWRIADANPEILDWTFLQAGTLIRIPNS